MVFQEIQPSHSRRIKNRTDLESELFGDAESIGSRSKIRDNEGEAAEYGVYFDDTEYDYMQHMRDLNEEIKDGDSYSLSVSVGERDGKGKQKMSLEDALKEASIQDGISRDAVHSSDTKTGQLLDEDVLPSKNLNKTSYQDQQDIPDSLAGFQPDMDPRLREVLEALEDEAYVDEEEDTVEDFFGELARDEKVGSKKSEAFELDNNADMDEDGGWETDDTVKPSKECKAAHLPTQPVPSEDVDMVDGFNQGGGDWMKEFNNFKKAEKAKAAKPEASSADIQSSIITGSSMTGGWRKKRKGAMTSSSGYSMTSSSLFRTEGLTLLDARFDKIEEDYAEDAMDDADEGASVMSGSSIATKNSSVASGQAQSLRSDFDSIMDEFLGSHSMSGRKRVKRGGYQTGLEQLEEIRKELGPARIGRQKA